MKKLFQVRTHLHGNGPVQFAWQPQGNFFASIGDNQKNMYIFDRRGVQTREVSLSSNAKVLNLEWDRDGEILAILQKGDSVVQLYHMATETIESLETNNKDCSWLGWSEVGPQLAIGSARGNLVIYNKNTLKKEPIIGKHTKKITCGAWSESNWLALGGEDKLISVSTSDGDLRDQAMVKADPSKIIFANGCCPRAPNCFSVVVGGAKLLVHSPTSDGSESQVSVELAFQAKYQNIRAHRWIKGGFIVVGFDTGYVVVISAEKGDQIDELSHFRYHTKSLDMLAVHYDQKKIATAGDGQLKMISMKGKFQDWKEIKSDRTYLVPETARVCQMHWSEDGQIFSLASDNGGITCYLTKVGTLAAAHNSRLCYLTSLRELTIVDAAKAEGQRLVLQTDIEPSFVALGPEHCAAGMNNRIWFYNCLHQGNLQLVNEHEYVGTVETCSLNSTHAAVLVEGRVFLHTIQPADQGGYEGTMIFPRKEEGAAITCACLAGQYLIYGDAAGHVCYAWDGNIINEFHHSEPIKRIFPNHAGTRVVLFDNTQRAYLYNPVNDDCLSIPAPTTADRILWDGNDPTIFVAVDLVAVEQYALHTFIYIQTAVGGSVVRELGSLSLTDDAELTVNQQTTPLPQGHVPVILLDGRVICQHQGSGELSTVQLMTHQFVHDQEDKRQAFLQVMALNRFQVAFQYAGALKEELLWRSLGRRALECLDITSAIRAYREVPSPGMVQWLERFEGVEDKQLLSAHIAALFGFFAEAQGLFLSSCNPEAALDMHCDLHEWDQAMNLAQSFAQHRLPEIHLKYAMQLESKGDLQQALDYYQHARTQHAAANEKHNRACLEGTARTAVRLGDLTRGVPLVKELAANGSTSVCKECAQVLEGMRQYQEAAELYEHAGNFEKAASLYIIDLNFDAAAPLMAKISSPKLQLQFAKAKESRHAYGDAFNAYHAAGDTESCTRLQLYHLKQADDAMRTVRETRDPVPARQCAEFAQSSGDIRAAVEFLVIAKNDSEAFRLAEQYDHMDQYVSALGGQGTNEQHIAIAQFFEKRNLLAEAAEHYSACGEYSVALRYYLKVGESQIEKAIEVVGKARNDLLTNTLIDYLMGESDHVSKDPNYVYRLHKALGNYAQAAQTAVLITKQEQDMGNYRDAHKLMLQTHLDLQAQKMAVPADLSRQLMLLHSYTLVKRFVKIQDHLSAAKLLCRVSDSIRSFPSHAVPILTSTVIECQRAGMKGSAYTFACSLMTPQYRQDIQEQYKKKIEQVVRKSGARENETDVVNVPCLFCGTEGEDTKLKCDTCLAIIPYCIVSGLRMLKDDFSYCNHCMFPARYSLFKQLAKDGEPCPMCSTEIDITKLKKLADFREEYEPLKAKESS